MREICFDTETTGTEPNKSDRIISIGCVEIDEKGNRTGKDFYEILDPECKISATITNITGFVDGDLKGKPKFVDIVDEFLKFIGNDTLVAHNAPFDIKFVNAELHRIGREPLKNKVIDTLLLAKIAITEGSRKLDALAEKYNVDASKRTKHGALIDSEILADVYKSLKKNEKIMEYNEFKDEKKKEQENFLSFKDGIKNKQKIKSFVFVPKNDEIEAHNKFIQKNVKGSIWQ
ncbi:MAG: 3'-5' exoribonuclease [Rickettsiales bacterium]|jgi:DNA polymerase-3 subunit epsilon|nr:3'-5' exoribonuclease [Rickettsiales bacterium]